MCEFAVIGAGPAGAALAALLASRGHEVIVVDRDTFPRDKVCGEFLSYDAVPILQLIGAESLADEVGAPLIDRCSVSGLRRRFEFEFPRAARGISRRTFDAALVDRARSGGARVITATTVTAIEQRDGRFILTCSGQDGDLRIVAQHAFGAWGRWGRLDRALQRPFVEDRAHRYFGFKRHYRIDRHRSSIDLYAFNRGYLGVAAVEQGMTNISGLVHDSRLSKLKGGWSNFTEALRGESAPLDVLLAAAEPTGDFLTSDPVIFGAKSAESNELCFAGDAAAMIDPLTGNGMAMAMQSAALLASYAVELARGQRSRYAAAYEKLFAPRIRWSRRVAYLLRNPRLLDAAIAATPARRIARALLARTRASEAALEEIVKRLRRSA